MQEKILVVDDDENIRDLMQSNLREAGYQVFTATNGEEAIQQMYDNSPNLVLLDLEMPKMNGFEVARKIRSDVLLKNVPVIVVTANIQSDAQLQAFGLDVDDYVTKPFQPDILMARVRSLLRRSTQFMETNPLTLLPGNITIKRELDLRITQNDPFAVLYIDLNDFKAFNDYYGFIRGDEVIVFSANILRQAVKVSGKEGDFVAHIGGDDFIAITDPGRMKAVADKIIQEFDRAIIQFYDGKDLTQGYIVTKNRKGGEQKFPVMTVSIAVVTNDKRKFSHPGEVSAVASELKKVLKADKKSRYIVDRREN
ncbi:MAG TPA: response regulator [bacterium]|nr:response regulator [bacterium]